MATFSDWACSLAGCDGGNRNAETWICGIEYGGSAGEDGDREWYRTELPREIADGTGMEASPTYSLDKNLKSPYNKSLAKLYTAYRHPKFPIRQYLDHLGDYSDTEILKLNLYPIPFRHVGANLWRDYNLEKITGFADKELYRIWCQRNRFPVLGQLVKDAEPRPKLIIGTGVSYLSDFFACFAGKVGLKSQIHVKQIKPQSEGNKHTDRACYWARLDNGTVLAVIPFFSGSNGLNSYYLLEKFGAHLRQIVDEAG